MNVRADWRQVSLIALLGLVGGVLYRHAFDPPQDASLANFIRSALHGVGLALAGWGGHIGLIHWPRFARASRDLFFLAIDARDPVFDAVQTRCFLETLSPRSVEEVPS